MRLFLIFLTTGFLLSCSSQKKTTDTTPMVEENLASINETAPSTNEVVYWSKYKEMDLPDLERAIAPKKFDLYQCQFEDLFGQVSEMTAISLPTNNGFETFDIEDAGTMNPALAAKFPEIKSFKGISEKGNQQLRLDFNEKGLFAEIRISSSEKILIAPLLKGSKTFYAVYNERDLTNVTPRDKSFE